MLGSTADNLRFIRICHGMLGNEKQAKNCTQVGTQLRPASFSTCTHQQLIVSGALLRAQVLLPPGLQDTAPLTVEVEVQWLPHAPGQDDTEGDHQHPNLGAAACTSGMHSAQRVSSSGLA